MSPASGAYDFVEGVCVPDLVLLLSQAKESADGRPVRGVIPFAAIIWPVRVDALAILLVRAQKVADLHFRSDRLIDNPYLRS